MTEQSGTSEAADEGVHDGVMDMAFTNQDSSVKSLQADRTKPLCCEWNAVPKDTI